MELLEYREDYSMKLQIRRSEGKDQWFVGYPSMQTGGPVFVIIRVFYDRINAETYIEKLRSNYG